MQVERVGSEEALLEGLVGAVRALDPDIILGWEVQQGSLGYLVDRAALLERPLLQLLSRTPQARPLRGLAPAPVHPLSCWSRGQRPILCMHVQMLACPASRWGRHVHVRWKCV